MDTSDTLSATFTHDTKQLIFDLLIPESAINSRIDGLMDYIRPLLAAGPDKVVLMPIRDGGDRFLDAVLHRLAAQKPALADALAIVPVKATRYSGTAATNELTVTQDIEDESVVTGKGVIIFDEIFETGTVAGWAYQRALDCGADWVVIITLVDKPAAHKTFINGKKLEPHMVGFVVSPPEAFLIGWGMDWYGQGRDLPWIGRLRDDRKVNYTAPRFEKFVTKP